MAPFQYEAPANPYVPSIGALLAHASDAAARATEISGNAWGRAAENIGQIPQQIQLQKNEEQLGKLRQSEIDKNNQEIAGQQRAVKGQQLLGQLTQKYTTTDPTTGVRNVDHDAIANDLTTNGFGAEAERFLHGAAVTAEDREKIKALKKQSAAATDIALGNIAMRAKDPADFLNDLDHLTLDDTVTPPQRQAIAQELSQLTPETWEAWKQKTIRKADQAAPPKTLKEGDVEYGGVSGTPLITAPPKPKTAAELAYDLSNADPAVRARAKTAIDALHPQKRDDTEMALDAYAKSIGKTKAEELTYAERQAYDQNKAKLTSDQAYAQHQRERNYDNAHPAPEKAKNQDALEQEYRTVLARGLSSRSGGLGLEDAKVQQANHLTALMDQNFDPKTGTYNIPKVQYEELALGLARLVSPGGAVGEGMKNDLVQATAAGDLKKVATYLTGTPFNGSTQDVFKMLRDSIERQGSVAMENREGEMRYLRGLAPTDLEEGRRTKLEATSLNPLRQSRVAADEKGARRLWISTDGGKTWK